MVRIADVDMPESYHRGMPTRPSAIPMSRRRFVVWDGEGIDLDGPKRPQSYVLFGCSTGETIRGRGLKPFEILDFILKVGAENPEAIHAGFAFGYDANMIVRGLYTKTLEALYRNGFARINRPGHGSYVIQYRPSKWFSVSRYSPGYDRKHNPAAKTTVRIYDLFGFFTCTFVKAVEDMLGPDAPGLEIVREGKSRRDTFTYNELDYVEHYWRAEIELLRLLAEELRKRLHGAGLQITQWHGPGALASYVMRSHGMRKHMAVNSDEVREAARYAYAGGRFELFKAGRVTGPIYSYDINSAYPYAISHLPSLVEGEWVYQSNPTRIARFGVYHVRINRNMVFGHNAAPLFHRDARHNISYPWNVEGWYWSPEVAGLLGAPYVEILEGWEYLGSTSLPFSWVQDIYDQRRKWKAEGNPQQLALKLCLNSLYGKMAQRVGYDERRKRTPPWHQLEWAGWVTAYTRAMLYRVMRRIPPRRLIAVETDGIYTTMSPDTLGITASEELGGWEIGQYDEVIYLQSGLAWLRRGEKWFSKRRGLDRDSLTLEDSIEYAKSLSAGVPWRPFIARSTRFIGLGAALNSSAPLKVRHCLWETTNREIAPGEKGKRVHVPHFCRACENGANAYEQPHDLVIRSLSRTGELSTPHNIPWEPSDGSLAEWREYQIREGL